MHQPSAAKADRHRFPGTDRRTLDYYHNHAQEYIARTANLPLGHLQKMLASVLPRQATVLDLGCGAGRDLKFFRRCGFAAVGIDYIEAFTKASSQHAPVVRGDITCLPFADHSFDGIWACAVLLHLAPTACLQALSEIFRVAKGGGALLISVKKGQGEIQDSKGRYFRLFNRDRLQSVLGQMGIEPVVIEESQDNRDTAWLNALCRIPMEERRPASIMDIAAALAWGQKILGAAGISENTSESQWILEDTLQLSKEEIYCQRQWQLPLERQQRYFDLLARRRSRYPLQYLLGYQYFMGIKLSVSPDVLIPRPETELLVEHVIEYIGKRDALVLDLGTGSGCIAVSILKYAPAVRVVASDISSNALKVAWMNAVAHQVAARIFLVQGDLLTHFTGYGEFDVIVANPPYICERDYRQLMPEVRDFEPSLALLAGDGLDFYRKILARAHRHLAPGGLLLLELGYGQAQAVKELVPGEFSDLRIIKDYADIDRVLIATRKEKTCPAT